MMKQTSCNKKKSEQDCERIKHRSRKLLSFLSFFSFSSLFRSLNGPFDRNQPGKQRNRRVENECPRKNFFSQHTHSLIFLTRNVSSESWSHPSNRLNDWLHLWSFVELCELCELCGAQEERPKGNESAIDFRPLLSSSLLFSFPSRNSRVWERLNIILHLYLSCLIFSSLFLTAWPSSTISSPSFSHLNTQSKRMKRRCDVRNEIKKKRSSHSCSSLTIHTIEFIEFTLPCCLLHESREEEREGPTDG